MIIQECIDKVVGFVDLFHVACTRDNDITRLEETDGNTLALTLATSITLALAELLTSTLARFGLVRSLVVIVLCINTLVDCTLKDTEDAIATRDDFMELVTAEGDTYAEVAINELFIEADDRRGVTPRATGELGDFTKEPLEGLYAELLGADARHLDGSIGKQLQVYLLPAMRIRVRLADNERGLIEEALGANLALRQGVTMTQTNHLVAVLELQDALARPPERNQDVMNVLKQLIQIESCIKVCSSNHGTNTQWSLLIEFLSELLWCWR